MKKYIIFLPGILMAGFSLLQCAGQQEFPTTGSVNRLSPELDKIIEPGVLPEIFAEGLQLYLKPSDYTGTIPHGGESGSNGLLLDPEGRLVLCQHGDRRIAKDTLKGAPDGLVVRRDEIIRTDQATSNCTLDADEQTLYITADMFLMRIKLL